MRDIMSSRKIFRIALAVVWIHYSISINLHESEAGYFGSKSKFFVNEEENNITREAGMEQLSFEMDDEVEGYKRHRRQSGCCMVPSATCNSFARYRTMDGTCNNLNNPCWGSAGIAFVRILAAEYQDGISTPRGTGQNLPRARDISAGLASVSSSVNQPISLMVMQFGQLLDHDMSFTPDADGSSCCTGSPINSCFPIDVTGDSFFSPFNVTCLPLGRSLAATCQTGTRLEQMNLLTAYVDASQIYGSSNTELNNLKLSGSYRMKFGPGKENSGCTANDPSLNCRSFLPERPNAATGNTEFFAGDRRVEEQPGLTSLHTIFLRMHNDLAEKLKIQNPNCPDDTVFQEIRLIIGSLMQQITYGEFLPFILGSQTMSQYSLGLSTYSGYKSNVDATLPNVFPTAIFRFGHSLIRNFFTLATTLVDLSRNFNNHAGTLTAGIFPSEFMKGIAVDPAEQMDHIVVEAVRNKLFARSPFLFGEDLLSRNIQRGREHGLPSYTKWVKYCFGITVTSFNDIRYYGAMPAAVIDKFEQLYSKVEDIDIFPAGIAESHYGGGILGDTFKCLMGEVFRQLKFGDRNWLQNGLFDWNQLNSIRSTTLAAIICRYAEGASKLPVKIMETVSSSNPLTNCSQILSGTVINNINLYWTNCIP